METKSPSKQIHLTPGTNESKKFLLKKADLSPSSRKTAKESSTGIKYLSQQNPIEVLPPEVIISNIEVNQTYEVAVLVRNLTNQARRIRIFQPKTTKFRCDYEMPGAIAAGLAMKLAVTFETSTLNDYHDELKIISDGGFELIVPLHAFMPQANLIFDPFVNFGFVQLFKEKTETIWFYNEGKKDGVVELNQPEKLGEIRLEKSKIIVSPGEKVPVKVTYQPKEAGILRGRILVNVQGQTVQKEIELSATSVDFFVFIIDEHGNQSTNFDFGDVYYGQKGVIETYLVNNSPKKYTFRTKFLQGVQTSFEEAASLQTPQQLGNEQTQRIMYCDPPSGVLESYSQISLKFLCKPAVTEKQRYWTKNYASVSGNYHMDPKEVENVYTYSCFFEMDGGRGDSLVAHLNARGVCPMIKLSQTLLDFGDCAVYDRRDFLITIENRNNHYPISLEFNKISQYNVKPKTATIKGGGQLSATVSFEPHNLGRFANEIDIVLLNTYTIPIRVIGSASSIARKESPTRGPEALPEDFEKEKKYYDADNTRPRIKKKAPQKFLYASLDNLRHKKALLSPDSLGGLKDSLTSAPTIQPKLTPIHKKNIFQSTEIGGVLPSLSSEKYDGLLEFYDNRQKYQDYLKNSRLKRITDEKDKIVKAKFEKMKTMMKEKNLSTKNLFNEDAPFDGDFWFRMSNDDLPEPRIPIKPAREKLHVVKPIGKYEPHPDSNLQVFTPDPKKLIKRKFSSRPQNNVEERDIVIELTPEMLKKVFAGPTTIDFGTVYVKSKEYRSFTVRNELRSAIMVEVQSTAFDELSFSNAEPQIIPSMQTAGFDLVFSSPAEMNFKQYLNYYINGKHRFKFLVTATVEPVQLELDREMLRFSFSDTNMEMTTYETIKIKNDGNAPGEFKFLPCIMKLPSGEDHRLYYVEPEQGIVPPASEYEVRVVYNPSGRTFKGEDGQIVMKVADGKEKVVRCTGYVLESRCVFKGVPGGTLNLGEIPVGQVKSIPIYLSNTHKNPAVYHIGEKVPAGVHISPPRGKISPDHAESITLTVQSNQEQSIKFELIAYIRGGVRQTILVTAQVVVPRVIIKEQEFNFGEVLIEHTAETIMTLYNESNIKAHLNLDLRERVGVKEKMGIECLEIFPMGDDGDDESSVMMTIHPGDDDERNSSRKIVFCSVLANKFACYEVSDNQLEDKSPSDIGDDFDEDDENRQKPASRLKQIGIKPKSTLTLKLKFTPKEPIDYVFELPIMLEGYGKIESLMRNVLCTGLKPNFILKPPTVVFKKKIIRGVEKPYPDYLDLIIENKERKPVSWNLDTRDIDREQVFSIKPSEGQIEAGEAIALRVGFSPVAIGDYEVKVPIYLNDKPQPYSYLTLKGEGAHPKLLFDRKEVILPITPVDIEAKAVFRVINDGFENLTLAYPTVAADVGAIPLEFRFLDGQNLGITRSKIRIEVTAKLKKPMSFTTRIEFMDDEKHIYPIMVSGTCDNCVLTNFPYMQRHWNDYEITCGENQPLMIKDSESDEHSQMSPRGGALSTVLSKTGTQASGGLNFFGYSQIPQHMIERTTDHIVKWLNFNVLTNNIARFPQDVIEDNGAQIFELLTYLKGKSTLTKAKLEGITKKSEKVKVLYKQYDDLIRNLKESGALLNSIRPEYLLKMHEYNFWVRTNPVPHVSNATRMTESRFNYISADAWITLFYQIIKLYYLGRVNLKAFRNLPGISPEKLKIPEYYLEGSNVYSPPENLLLRWLEIQYESVKVNHFIRLKNFDTSLKDGTVFATLLQSYMGSARLSSLKEMRSNPQTEDDFRHNAQKIIDALSEMRLQTHFTAKDLMNPSQREMVLFCLYLYNNLPHYMPKAQIEFHCVLGESVTKYIELSNPTSKTISYRVELENERNTEVPDFTTEIEEIKLEPRSVSRIPVTFQSKVSAPVKARITFTNKKESNAQAATLAFDLISHITGRVSRNEITIKSKLYQMLSTEIRVENPFQKAANFQIRVEIESKNPDDGGKKKFGKHKKTYEPKTEPMPDAFFVKQEKLPKTSPGGFNPLPIFFCPFLLEQYKCNLIFIDENVGEMQYTIIGEVELPDPIPWEQKVTQFKLDGENKLEIPLQFKNKHLEEAKRLWKSTVRPYLRDEFEKKAKNWTGPEQIPMEIENPSPYLVTPPTFVLYDSLKGKKGQPDKKKPLKAQETSNDSRTITDVSNINSENRLIVDITFKSPVPEYRTRLIFRNPTKTDIRVYEISIQINPKPIQAILEFRVPARQRQVQPIPIMNRTDKDWQINIEFSRPQDKHGDYFNGPRDKLFVRRGKVEEFKLSFEPKWMSEKPAQAKLILRNPATNDVFEYELIGYVEEPLSEGHRIVKCRARHQKDEVFEVPNPYSDEYANYTVETDLPEDWVIGRQNFSVPPGKVGKYALQITPNLGGIFTGSITFKDQKGRYYWWTIEIQTESPKAEKALDMVADVRKQCVLEVTLKNPMEINATYEVVITGEGLSGDPVFTVPANSTAEYQLVFSPFRPMTGRGSVAFLHAKLGEVWYDLNLNAKDSPPIRLNTLFSELGKTAVHEIELENPSNKVARVRSRVTNPLNFAVVENEIEINPHDVIKAHLQYSPSELEATESGEVFFESDEIGKWQFYVFGRGLPPTKYEEKVIVGAPNKDSSGVIMFRNPFKDGITVTVRLEAEGVNRDAFELLLKKTTVLVNGMNIIQIPFSFLPRAISDFFCEIVVMMNEKISWRYPIRGVTESFFNNMEFAIKTPCRRKYEDDLKVFLPGLGQVENDDVFTLEVTNYPKDVQHILSQKKWLDFKPKKTTLEDSSDFLLWQIHFAPLKPMRTYLEVAIHKSSGGRWKFRLLIDATEPAVDDNIIITSPLNKPSTVSFKLTNLYKNRTAEFKAYFTPDSDPEFSIQPKEGVLPPFGQDGQAFYITYVSMEYGRLPHGKLVIETDEMYWSYIVKGQFPKYVPPQTKAIKSDQSPVLSIESKKAASPEKKKNFVAENIRKSTTLSQSNQNSPKKDSNAQSSRDNSPERWNY